MWCERNVELLFSPLYMLYSVYRWNLNSMNQAESGILLPIEYVSNVFIRLDTYPSSSSASISRSSELGLSPFSVSSFNINQFICMFVSNILVATNLFCCNWIMYIWPRSMFIWLKFMWVCILAKFLNDPPGKLRDFANPVAPLLNP